MPIFFLIKNHSEYVLYLRVDNLLGSLGFQLREGDSDEVNIESMPILLLTEQRLSCEEPAI